MGWEKRYGSLPISSALRGREEREERKRGREERENEDVDKTWQPRGGRNHKTVHLSGNVDVVPQSGPKMKGRATIRCLPLKIKSEDDCYDVGISYSVMEGIDGNVHRSQESPDILAIYIGFENISRTDTSTRIKALKTLEDV